MNLALGITDFVHRMISGGILAGSVIVLAIFVRHIILSRLSR